MGQEAAARRAPWNGGSEDRRSEQDLAGGRRRGPRTRMDSELPVEAPNRARRPRTYRQGRQRIVGPATLTGDRGRAGSRAAR